TGPRAPQALLTPQQAAQQVLAKVGPTTAVSVDTNAMVAGQPAYQLVLAPKDHRSLVGSVLIAIDAANGLPLRVQVLARGASSPAISVGYTSISFGMPPAAQTSFTPPPGATVTTVNPAAVKDRGRQDSAPAVTTIGTGWLTVVDLPSSALTSAGQAPVQAAGAPDDSARVLRLLLGSASPVHGAWGSGRLLRTALVSVLMTDTGRTFAGAVQPSVLYAAALHAAAAQHR
ncbi:MAG: DUF2092 domain-containing protein, partial [Streptosporangiaceae bacterium]|nr:DUF2092 domain-containing protein [Streptosporangiaceae bacterium]